MKNKFFKFISFFVVLLALSSCEEEVTTYDSVNGGSLIGFRSTTINFSIPNEPLSDTLIQVDISSKSDIARTFSFEVDPTITTALPNEYQLDGTTFEVPAGAYNGFIKFSSSFSQLPTTPQKSVFLNLTEVTGSVINQRNRTVRVNLVRVP